VPDESTPEADPRPEKEPKKRNRSFLRELPILIGVALVLSLLIKTFLVQAF
jgi:signal peptidase I